MSNKSKKLAYISCKEQYCKFTPQTYLVFDIKWLNISANMKLLKPQLNKLKSTTKNATEKTLRLSTNMIGNNETNLLHNLQSTDRKVSSFAKAFADKSSDNLTMSKR